MRLSEAHHRQVVSTSTAATVGRIDWFVVVPGPARVLALRLGRAAGDASLLAWSDLSSFGPDAVTVRSAGLVRVPRGDDQALADKARDLIGKPAYTEGGNSLGTVQDAHFDTATGTLTTILTDRHELPGDRLIGLGTYAAVFAGSASDADR